MAWLVTETFILILLAVFLGVAIGMVARRIAGASGQLAFAGAAEGDLPAGAAEARPMPPVHSAPDLPHTSERAADRAHDATPATAAPAAGDGSSSTDGSSYADDAAATEPLEIPAMEAHAEPVTPPPVRPTPGVEAAPAPSVSDSIIDGDRAAAADQLGVRPEALAGPRDGRPDDLKRIKGIGPQNEARLNALGIFHFDQIAGWSPEESRWVGTYLAFPGRIEREDWIGQARALSTAA